MYKLGLIYASRLSVAPLDYLYLYISTLLQIMNIILINSYS